MTVSPATVRTVLGVVGNVIALVRYLSPVPTFYRIWKNGSVERYSAAPYLATLLNCMLWMLYGLPAVQPHSLAIIVISATGMATQLAYITIFLAFSGGSAARRRLVLLLVAVVVFVGVVAALVLSLAHTHGTRAMIVGVIMVVFGTGMYASPLTVMKMVIQTKSVEYMPLFLSITLLLNSICWTAYAPVLRFDLYLTIANGLGVIFSVAQLILYAVYYKSTQQIIKARNASPSSVSQPLDACCRQR